MNCSAIIRTGLVVAVLALAGGCSGDNKESVGSSGGSGVATGGAAPSAGGTTGSAGANSTAGTGGTNVAGAPGTGGAGGAPTVPFVYFVEQSNGTTTATLAGGVITVNSAYSSSGNAFKYVAPNYYGTNSNGFIAFPTSMSGDFSIDAQVTITTQNKSNNACGIGLGLTTGFNATDTYAYVLMRNSNNSTNSYYVSGTGAVSAGAPNVAFTNGSAMQLTFSRSGTNVTFSAGAVGGTPTSQTLATSALTDGTTVYGTGPVYPAISFNNVAATITKLLIKDATGATVYDSDSGTLVTYVPASLTISQISASMKKGASTSVTATAVAIGGNVSTVTAVAADPTIVDVSVTPGTTSSTINLNGLKGGVTTVTITNTGDTNTVTNTKTVTVSVNDYEPTDNYGSLAALAYPAPGATNAYTDGELALTFDSPPTLNTGGSIQIFKVSDGTPVDSIAFSG